MFFDRNRLRAGKLTAHADDAVPGHAGVLLEACEADGPCRIAHISQLQRTDLHAGAAERATAPFEGEAGHAAKYVVLGMQPDEPELTGREAGMLAVLARVLRLQGYTGTGRAGRPRPQGPHATLDPLPALPGQESPAKKAAPGPVDGTPLSRMSPHLRVFSTRGCASACCAWHWVQL
jgi:hypothetical protein